MYNLIFSTINKDSERAQMGLRIKILRRSRDILWNERTDET